MVLDNFTRDLLFQIVVLSENANIDSFLNY